MRADLPALRADQAPAGRTHDGRTYRVLLAVRHPVGGIRTFFRYVYPRFDAHAYGFTLVAPELRETRQLLQDLGGLAIDYVPIDEAGGLPALMKRVSTIMRSGRFDLVHSHGFTSAACCAPAAVLARVPHLTSCHDVFTRAQFAGATGGLRKLALTLALSSTSAIHCVSHSARDNLLSHLPWLRALAPEPTVIVNGIDSAGFLHAKTRDLRSELRLPRECFLIGFFGRFMSQKGFRYLVDALACLLTETSLPRRPVVLAFGHPEGFIREEQARVARMGLSDSIRFLPFVADIAASLKGLDVVAMPSLWEACGLLAMEAMVAGVPLIATGCDGLGEVLADTPAVTVPPADSKALAQAIRAEMRAPTAAVARAFAVTAATRFDAAAPAAALERMLRDVLAARSLR